MLRHLPVESSHLSMEHVLPSLQSGGVPDTHTCEGLQRSSPLQNLPSEQSPLSLQLNLQSLSQPSPLVVLPSSHISPRATSVKPSVQMLSLHTPLRQMARGEGAHR